MTSSPRVAALALFFAALPIAAQAGDGRRKPISPRDRVAIETAQKFSARMSRLDALMGSVPHSPGATRARSANAEY